MENEAALLCVTFRERARVSTCKCNLGYNFLIYLLLLKSSVFVVHFSNAFWHGNEAFLKGSSQNEIAPLLVIFHLPYSKCRGVKICFYLCCYQNQNFSPLSHSCCSCSTRVAPLPHSCRSCRMRVARVWRSCCKLDQISQLCIYFHYSANCGFISIQQVLPLYSLFK